LEAVGIGMASYILLTLVGLWFLTKRYTNLRPKVEELDLLAVHQWIEDEAELWDVRSEREWDTGVLEGCRLVEYGDIPSGLNPDKKVVCFCTSGIRAREMAEKLKKGGVKTTAFFQGGFHHLKEDSAFTVVVPS